MRGLITAHGPRAALIVPLLLLSACAVPALGSRPDLERTWHEAIVVLPAAPGQEPLVTMMDSPVLAAGGDARGRRDGFPTVIYMHGCTGPGDREFLKRLGDAGFAVIAPDSFARRYRPLQCDPRSKTGGYNLFVYEFRLAELAYALDRIDGLAWVDKDNLFLIGSSEGGVAAALYRGDEFKARVITQWSCNGAAIVRGIAAPPAEPILAIVHADDPWYAPDRTRGQSGHCGDFMAGRPSSRSIVIAGSGRHDIFKDGRNVEAILAFLERHRRD